MIYRNTSDMISEMEKQRTGNYGNYIDEEVKQCPCCGYKDPEEFYTADGECIGCSSCISRVEWEDYVV